MFGDGEAETNEILMMAKPRPMNLVSHTKRNKVVFSSGIWKQMRGTSQNPAVYVSSQARQQEDTQNANT